MGRLRKGGKRERLKAPSVDNTIVSNTMIHIGNQIGILNYTDGHSNEDTLSLLEEASLFSLSLPQFVYMHKTPGGVVRHGTSSSVHFNQALMFSGQLKNLAK